MVKPMSRKVAKGMRAIQRPTVKEESRKPALPPSSSSPIASSPTLKERLMKGHATPKMPSGRPRMTKAT